MDKIKKVDFDEEDSSFKFVDYDVKLWSGFAFGIGIERIAMLKYGVKDIRMFYNGDIQFLSQIKP